MNKLNTAVIGLGVGAQHAIAYQNNEHCELTHVCDIDEKKLNWAKKEFPKVSLHSSAEDILRHPDIDLVSIASYDQDHAQQILIGLDYNKHLFIEKPVCLLKSEAEAIAEKLREKPHLKISSNLILREYPIFQKLKSWIQEGRLGRIYSVEGDYNYGRLHKIIDGWRGTAPNYSVTFGGAVHLIDAFQWMLGSQPTQVVSMSNKICSEGTSFKNPDFVSSLFEWNGITVKITSNFGCVQPHFHNLKVYGTEGTFVHGINGTFISSSRDPEAPLENIDLPYPGCKKGDLIAPFIQDIMTGSSNAVGQQEIFDTLSICLAVDQSHVEGKKVNIAYLKADE